MAAKRKYNREEVSRDGAPKYSPPLEGEQTWTGTIVGEREDAFKVKWDPNPRSGEKYASTWEPKKNCNDGMVLDWRQRQKMRKQVSEKASTSRNTSSAARERSPSPSRPKKKRKVEPTVDSQTVTRVGPPKRKPSKPTQGAFTAETSSSTVSRRQTEPSQSRRALESDVARRHSASTTSQHESRPTAATRTSSLRRKQTAEQPARGDEEDQSMSRPSKSTQRSGAGDSMRSRSSIAHRRPSIDTRDLDPTLKSRWELYEAARSKLPVPRLPEASGKGNRRQDSNSELPVEHASVSRPPSPQAHPSPQLFETSPNKRNASPPPAPAQSKTGTADPPQSPVRPNPPTPELPRRKKRPTATKPLRPLPRVSPSNFNGLPPSGSAIESAGGPTQAETISEFSPEKRRTQSEGVVQDTSVAIEGDDVLSPVRNDMMIGEMQRSPAPARKPRRPLGDVLDSYRRLQPEADQLMEVNRPAEMDEIDDATREMESYVDFDGGAGDADSAARANGAPRSPAAEMNEDEDVDSQQDRILLRQEQEESTQDLLMEEQEAGPSTAPKLTKTSDVDTNGASVMVHPATQLAVTRQRTSSPPPEPKFQSQDASFVPPTPEDSQRTGMDITSSQEQQRIQELLSRNESLVRDLASSQTQSQSFSTRVESLEDLLLQARRETGVLRNQHAKRDAMWKKTEKDFETAKLEWEASGKEWEEKEAQWNAVKATLKSKAANLEQRCAEWEAKEQDWQQGETKWHDTEREWAEKERQLQDKMQEREKEHELKIRDMQEKLSQIQNETATDNEKAAAEWTKERNELQRQNADLTHTAAESLRKVAELEVQISESERKLADLQAQKTGVDCAIADLIARQAVLEPELTNAHREVAERTRAFNDAAKGCQIALKTAETASDARQEALDTLAERTQALTETKQALADKSEELSKTQQLLEEANSTLAVTRTHKEMDKQEWADERVALEKNVENLIQQTAVEWQGRLTVLEEKLKSTEEELKEAVARAVDAEREAELLRGAKGAGDAANVRATAAEEKAKAAAEKVKAAEEKVKAAEEKVQAAEQRAKAAEQKAKAAEEQATAANEKVEAADERAAALQDRADAAEKRSADAAAELQEEEARMAESRKEVEKLVPAAMHEANVAKADLKETKENLRKADEDRRALQEKAQALESQLAEMETDASELRVAGNAAKKDLEQQRIAYEELKAQLATHETREAEISAEVSSLQSQLAVAQAVIPAPAARAKPMPVAAAIMGEHSALTERLAELEARLVAETRARIAADDEVEFVRKNYMEASAHVGDLRKEAVALNARATLAEDQVKRGLATVRETLLMRARALEGERDSWRKQAEWVRELDARTNNGEVRRKAAERDELAERVEALAVERRKLAIERDKRAEERDDLAQERTKAIAARDKLVVQRNQLVVERDALVVRLEAVEAQSAHLVEEQKMEINALKKSLKSTRAELEQKEHECRHVYPCQWRPDGMSCEAFFESVEDLETHVRQDHLNE